MLSRALETFETHLQANELQQDDLIQIIQEIEEIITDNNFDDSLLPQTLILLTISYKHVDVVKHFETRAVDCFREILRFKGQEIMKSMELFALGLQAVQSISENIETTLCEIADDISGISTIIQIHVSCLHLLGDALQTLRNKLTSDGGDTFLLIEFLVKQKEHGSSVCSCVLKTCNCALTTTKVPAVINGFSKNCELRQLISTWCKRAHEVLGDFLKFIDENLMVLDSDKLDLDETVAFGISDVCNGLIPIAEASATDYPALTLTWKYLVRLSVKHKSDVLKRTLKLDSIILILCRGVSENYARLIKFVMFKKSVKQTPSDAKQFDKMLTIVRFYIAHLLSIAKAHAEVIAWDANPIIIQTLRTTLTFLVSKMSPMCGMSTYFSDLLQGRVLLVVNNVFLALFINDSITNDDYRCKMIFNFFNCDLDSVNRNHSSLLGDIKIDEFKFARIHFLLVIFANFDDIPISLHSKLFSDPTKSQTFCLLRLFFDTLDDYPECFLFTSIDTPNAENFVAPQIVDSDLPPLEDSFYMHVVITFCTFVNMLSPLLFTLCEYHMLEFLLISRSTTTCALIIDVWCCIGKSLANRELYHQVQLILEIISKLPNTPSVRYRLQRLSKRLIQFLDSEQVAKASEQFLFPLPDGGEAALVSGVTEVQIKMSGYAQICSWINFYVQNVRNLSADGLFALHFVILHVKNILLTCNDIQLNPFNLVHMILEFLKNCIYSLNDLQPSSPEFRKIFTTVESVFCLLTNTRSLSIEEAREILRTTDLWISSPHLKRFICFFGVYNFIADYADTLLQSSDKQSLISIFEESLQSADWLKNHEATALIANLEIIQLVVSERHESIKRFTNHSPSHFDNEPVTESDFWKFNDNGEVDERNRLLPMKDLLNDELTSLSRILYLTSCKVDKGKNSVMQEQDCLNGACLVRNFIREGHQMAITPEIRNVLSNLRDLLNNFFDKE
ncbi:15926_t:CDS:10 [Acaulospora morrowiae]|uniref:15926_t:CDS:1 n=1 Tax=Acaulospora morrowiae TaxID=94023 RepID=A0A9N9B5R6_9GLOM|nr:15926_t:CDS:10 [Acaulospora morrowiae]